MRRFVPWLRCVAALMLPAAATACGGPTEATHTARACSVERVAEVPVRFVQGHVLVPASVDGHPVQFIVDTGASTSMLTTEATADLGLPRDAYRTTTVHGTGGVVVTHNTMISSLAVGSQDWVAGSVTTGQLSGHYDLQPMVAGLLGADYLSRFDIELDMPDGRLVLWQVADCSGDFIPWKAPHFAIPLAVYPPNRMVAHVRVDDHPVAALVDWGARSTTMKTATAAALGVTSEMLHHDRSGTMRGVDQTEVPVYVQQFSEVQIGPATFRNISVEVADLQVADVGMLLGADYISRRHVWLSYATDQLFVERRTPGTPTAAR
jgi:predicted aspartyl protease